MAENIEMGNTPYSIDGGTNGLAFDPDNDDVVEISMTPSGGIVASKINDVIIVDGSVYPKTSAGITSAYNALPSTGGKIYLPTGEYTIDAIVQFPPSGTSDSKPVVLEGAGWSTILKQADGANLDSMIYDYTTDNVVIRNLKIDGNKTNQTTGTGIGISSYLSTSNHKMRIEGCYVYNTRGNGIQVARSNYDFIINNLISDCGSSLYDGYGIRLYGTQGYTTVSGNIIYNTWNHAIAGEGIATPAPYNPNHLVISGNIIWNVYDDQNDGMHLSGFDQVVITDNVIGPMPEATIENPKGNNGIYCDAEHAVVANNVIDQVTGVGIELGGNSPYGDHDGQSYSYIVSHNSIRLKSAGADSASDANGIWIDAQYCLVDGNLLEDATQYGIYVTGGSNYCKITNNTIKNTQCTDSANYSAIYVSSSVTGLQLIDNLIYDDQIVPTMHYGIRGAAAITLTSSTISGNKVYGAIDGAYSGIPETEPIELRDGVLLNAGSTYTTTLKAHATTTTTETYCFPATDGTNGYSLITDGNGNLSWKDLGNAVSVSCTIDGGGAVITTGIKGEVRVPMNMTITGWEITANTSSTITVDIWKDTYANYPPADADSICNGHEPAISAGIKAQDVDLADWSTVAITAGDYIRFNVDANDNATKILITLYGTKL